MKPTVQKKAKIENTKKGIFEAFERLGWKFRHHGIGFYNFVTPDDKELDLEIWFPNDLERPERVEQKHPDYHGSICFMLNKCHFEWLGDDCISLIQSRIKNPPCFINFSNHE